MNAEFVLDLDAGALGYFGPADRLAVLDVQRMTWQWTSWAEWGVLADGLATPLAE
ncbi:hypothetical protein KVH07_10185 [Streptomyces olivaceus]|uniref:hypothetical protein n=1 Tax=Streptomyces olivaceus TaxID=47716 RepID=UPI001CCAD7E6|nr:hypothetical protein [Streptomyces olivaceus]MBZ6193301.1 hypothetical protein [Streptomyces olivaceus]MBZ6198382.1 hypothetical protein [Streptomyces olivaceus]MBZ6206431.1 hypothetical protein [Streptomyces olivaceus]